jgi:glycosyltransferase involved in cell wall biosynthesis
MRIGIDATALPPQPVGAGNYIINLIRSFAALDSDFEFVVFVQQSRQHLFDLPPTPGLHWQQFPDASPARRLAWEQITFPGLAKHAGIALLHSPHYTHPYRLHCPSVVTFHDMTFFLYPHLHTLAKRFFFATAIRISARHANALIAISESTRQDAIRLLEIPPNKISAIPLGVDENFHPVNNEFLLADVRQRYNLPEKFILYVGVVEPRKNLPLLLKSYKTLVNEGINHPLVIVGRFGWMYNEVLRQIDTLGLKSRIHFTGYVPQADLPIVYNLADVFVYPSIYEGFGLPPLEAMACGTPVITTAISSMPEHVGDAGILVPAEDEWALSRAIHSVLTDRMLHDQLSLKGPRQAAKFTWKRTAQETLQVYKKVLQT